MEDGTSGYMTIPPAPSRERAVPSRKPALAGVATGGRAALVYGWAVSSATAGDAISQAVTTNPAMYDLFAIVPSESGDPEWPATAAAHSVNVWDDPLKVELESF